MLLWIFFIAFVAASPPGSPQSQESYTSNLLVDNPNSKYFHQSPTLHVASPSSVPIAQPEKVKSKSSSPALPHQAEARESSPEYDSSLIQKKLLTDPTSDYYHYIRLLSPKEHLNANNPKKEKKRKTSSSQAVNQPNETANLPRKGKKRKLLTDAEKLEHYEAKLSKQRITMANIRKNALSGVSIWMHSEIHNEIHKDTDPPSFVSLGSSSSQRIPT